MKLSVEHPEIIEAASKAFWNACRVDLGCAVQSFQDTFRDPAEEFEKVREAVRKGMTAAMAEANKMQSGRYQEWCAHEFAPGYLLPEGGVGATCKKCGYRATANTQ